MRIFPLNHLCQRGWDQLFFTQRLRRTIPVVICQMGKVGSGSLFDSLRKQYRGVVLHSHTFTPDDKAYRIRCLYRWAVKEQRPLLIISPIREPVGRNVSAFFQNFKRETGTPCTLQRFPLDELRRLFLASPNHNAPLTWFDEQIRTNVGIDVFATPFPANGCAQYSHGNTRLLVLRSDLDDGTKARAVADFIGLPNFIINNTNISSTKKYGESYQAFRHKVRLPAEYVETMIASKYFKHFYSRETIESVRREWLAPQ